MERSLRALLAALLSLAALSAQELRDPLIGRVLDPDGAPVTGAVVEVWRAGGRGTALLDLDYRNDFRRIAVARADADGRFAAHVPVGLPCRVVVDHAPFARYLREDCLPSDDMTIRLQAPGVLQVAAVLPDGRGVP
ncbi:MAG: hypothetical protein H6835_20700, partial [Planctomycetes bacterium]|nr:hypothetical protein [Planctomycetota bacterium]